MISIKGQEHFLDYGTEAFSQGLFEYQGNYYLSYWDEKEVDSIYVHQFYKLDEMLNRVDSIEFSSSDFLGPTSILSGRFSEANGSLEFVGLGAYKHELGTVEAPEDSTYFIRISFDQNFDITVSEKKFLRNGFYLLADLTVHDGAYFYSAKDAFVGYWVGRISTSLQQSSQSGLKFLNPGFIPTYNPHILTKIINDPEFEGLYLRTDAVHIDVYNAQLDFDSVYSIPMVDFGVPSYGWMSQGYIALENSYFVASSSGSSSYFLHLNSSSEFINEFSFSHQDSTVSNSLYRVLSADSEMNLYIGMHIRDTDDEIFNQMKVIKCDTLGNLIWQSTFGEGGDVEYVHREILCTTDGGVLILADRYSMPGSDNPDGVILYKLNELGEVSGVTELFSPYTGIKVYPNPASEVLRLPVEFNELEYRVFDMSGQEITKGIVTAEGLDVSKLSSGSYILRIATDGSRFAQPFVVE